jgi:hypothetical protein
MLRNSIRGIKTGSTALRKYIIGKTPMQAINKKVPALNEYFSGISLKFYMFNTIGKQ